MEPGQDWNRDGSSFIFTVAVANVGDVVGAIEPLYTLYSEAPLKGHP